MSFQRWCTRVVVASALALIPSQGSLAQQQARIWHVDDDAPPGGDGVDWETAFDNLQTAIDAAQLQTELADLILVAGGAYVPTVETEPGDPRSATFRIEFLNVTIRGGHAGWEDLGDPYKRDVEEYETILSGDLPPDPPPAACGPGAGDCFAEHGTPGCDDEACCAAVCENDPVCCDPDWFWDQDCVEDANEFCPPAPPGVYHVVDIRSATEPIDFRTRLEGLTISGGDAFGGGRPNDDFGGGMLIGRIANGASPLIVGCTFTGNVATHGGAVAVRGLESSPLFVNCRFLENEATSTGGAVRSTYGRFVNCLFADNTAGTGNGGAIFNESHTEIINCTLTGNSAGDGGAGWTSVAAQGVDLAVGNSILWGNTPDEISGPAGVVFSNVQGGHAGDGNIDVDPMFVAPATGDYRLDLASECIDAGSDPIVPSDAADLDGDGIVLEPTPLDLALRPRLARDLLASGGSVCDRGPVNMGAFESGDCDGDAVRDEDEQDVNGDGVPDDCQDCDSDGPLDPEEIAQCEDPGATPQCADCNANAVPDGCDITGTCSLDKDGNGVPDECECDPDVVDVVFLVDSSGSMATEISDVCATATAVVDGLAAACADVEAVLLWIEDSTPPSCPSFPGTVDELANVIADLQVPGAPGACGPELDSPESWGPATAVVAERYAWRQGAVRVIVPVSDEGACRGDNKLDPCNIAFGSADRDSIENAVIVANMNGAYVFPITGEFGVGETTDPECVRTLADRLGSGTEGFAFHVDLVGYPAIAVPMTQAILLPTGSCVDPCPEDVTGDCVVGVDDFLAVLASWTPFEPCQDCVQCAADVNGDIFVGVDDFLAVLAGWGACPGCAGEAGAGGGGESNGGDGGLLAALNKIGFASFEEYQLWALSQDPETVLDSAFLLLVSLADQVGK